MHPYKAIGFTWALTLLCVLASSGTVHRYFWGLFSAIAVLWLFVLHKDTRNKLVALVLACSLLGIGLTPPPKAKAEVRSGPLIVAIVIIVVGGVVSCKIVRFCQKNFGPTPPAPANTNAPPDEFGFGVYSLNNADDAAASYSGSGIEYCWEETWPADSDPECGEDCDVETNETDTASSPMMLMEPMWLSGEQPTVPADLMLWHLRGTHRNGRPVITYNAFLPRGTNGELPLINGEEFNRIINGHGIDFYWGGYQSFARNGRRCAPEDCPIRFEPDPARPNGLPNVRLNYGVASRKVLVQRSRDLVTWTTVMRTELPEGLELQFEDLTRYSKAFYRLKIDNTPTD